MNRWITRVLLVLSLTAAIGVGGVAIVSAGPLNKEAWAIVAAALAVITSVTSSWSAQRILEQQEDSQNPYVLPSIDNKSRIGLLLLRVKNYGGGPAYDIHIEWENPLLNAKGEPVTFSRSDDVAEIRVLLPQESLAILINGQVDYFRAYKDEMPDYTGTIKFKDVTGKQLQHRFRPNAGQIAKTLVHDSEEPEAYRKLQELPKAINDLTSEVRSLRQFVAYKLDDGGDG